MQVPAKGIIMRKQQKIWAVAIVAALVAGAFFLPELLLSWEDSQSLDILRLESQDEDREGFAGSIQLTVPEKILLLRSGELTVMELDRMVMESAADGGGDRANTVILFSASDGEREAPPELKAGTEEEIDRYTEEARRVWEERLASVRGEVRSLQALGGLPEVWRSDGTPDYTGYGDLLYLDPDTYMSFQVYQMVLRWEDRSLDLLVDVQSGRILSFALRWTQSGQLNWGPRGASGFGSAWRDYWKMDSVSTSWYNEYTRSVLENVETQVFVNGDYAAHDQITFLYDSQSLAIPLDCQGSHSVNYSLIWNR